jgi:hypothetical protein
MLALDYQSDAMRNGHLQPPRFQGQPLGDLKQAFYLST